MTKYLVDVNVLIALVDQEHIHYPTATAWLDGLSDQEWGACAFSQAGFLRVMTNRKIGTYSVEEATKVLIGLSQHPKYRFWPIDDDWVALTNPLLERVYGHQQITNAYLLGLAIKERGVLVTMDKAIRSLAGPRLSQHVLLLQ